MPAGDANIQFLAHRGFWQDPKEKNSLVAFQRAFDNGFGIETDLRDFMGSLVIAHDPPAAGAKQADLMSFHDFLKLVPQKGSYPLALNIKADGLAPLMKKALEGFSGSYFCFDGSVPDSLHYLRHSLPYFGRLSEHEPWSNLNSRLQGLWVDQFQGVWFDAEEIKKWGALELCFVSPELHGRAHLDFWHFLKKEAVGMKNKIFLCTDFPLEAHEFFYGKN